jgi:hypothetical protein
VRHHDSLVAGTGPNSHGLLFRIVFTSLVAVKSRFSRPPMHIRKVINIERSEMNEYSKNITRIRRMFRPCCTITTCFNLYLPSVMKETDMC